MTLGERIKARRQDLDLTQTELASLVGYSDRSAIAKIESGVNDISQSKLSDFAYALETTPAYLLGLTDDWYDYERDEDNRFANIPTDMFNELMRIYHGDLATVWRSWNDIEDDAFNEGAKMSYLEPYQAPIVGAIPAGYPALAFENVEGYAPIAQPDSENYFFLRVRGDSMINAGIVSGDLVLIRKQDWADDGQIVACRVNGDEATLKRFKRQGDTVLLLPENPAYDPRIVPVSDFDRGDARIVGVALETRHPL